MHTTAGATSTRTCRACLCCPTTRAVGKVTSLLSAPAHCHALRTGLPAAPGFAMGPMVMYDKFDNDNFLRSMRMFLATECATKCKEDNSCYAFTFESGLIGQCDLFGCPAGGDFPLLDAGYQPQLFISGFVLDRSRACPCTPSEVLKDGACGESPRPLCAVHRSPHHDPCRAMHSCPHSQHVPPSTCLHLPLSTQC
jgi:hypothetical protein